MIELSFVLIILVMIVFGGLEYGWLFYRMRQVSSAARRLNTS